MGFAAFRGYNSCCGKNGDNRLSGRIHIFMEKADNPLAEPFTARFMSREGWVSLAVVLSVHLFVAVWIGWNGSFDEPEMAAPMTGILVAGDNGRGRGGNGNTLSGQAGEKNGADRTLWKKTRPMSGGTGTKTTKYAAEKRTVKARDDDSDRVTAGKQMVPNKEKLPAVPSEKTDGATGTVDAAGAGAIPNGNENVSAGTSAYGSGNGSSGGGHGDAGNGSGGFSGPYGDAGFLKNPKPPYPAVSRRMGEEGVVVLSVMIEADGTVSDVRVKRSSGFPRLDASALETVRRWQYVPAKRNGFPVAYRYVQPVRFSLDD